MTASNRCEIPLVRRLKCERWNLFHFTFDTSRIFQNAKHYISKNKNRAKIRNDNARFFIPKGYVAAFDGE